MHNNKEKNYSGSFEWTYKIKCRERNVKPLPAVQMYLQKNYLRFCADNVNVKDWSPILSSIIQDRSLSKISVYSRYRRKKIREKLNTEEKLAAHTWKCARNGRQQPVLYTNFLLRCFVHSVAACLRDSLMITDLALDGIPLTLKYLRILGDGLANNRNLQNLSLAKCRIGDTGCDILLESLQHNPSLRTLNLSSCCLTNRSTSSLSVFFKKKKADLLQNMWKESMLPSQKDTYVMEEGLRVLILDKNYKISNIGLQQLIRMLKHDFWLRVLCLRCCGITQHGGQNVLGLLQTNSVLTHIDLRDNKISIDVLQTISKILKRRQNKGEREPMKRRLLSRNHDLGHNIILKKAFSEYAPRRIVFRKNQVHSIPVIQCGSQASQHMRRVYIDNAHVLKTKRKLAKKSHNALRKTNVLKKSLLHMIEGNQKLITALENSTDFLMKERDRRLIAEEAYRKLQPRLTSLRNKIRMKNSVRSNHYENHVYVNLQNIFNKLRTFLKDRRFEMLGKSLEEANEMKNNNIIVHYYKNQPYKSKIAHLSHRISNRLH